LHAVLAAAALLVAWPWAVRSLLAIAVLAHGIVRRPCRPPSLIVLGNDGGCVVPDWSQDRLRLGAGTLVCAYWVRLAFGAGPPQRDIVLFADQLQPREWARLRALLLRLRCV
jgi:hypothetical protein